MQFLRAIGAIFVAWADHIAAALVELLDRLISPRIVHLWEQADGRFEVRLAEGKTSAKGATSDVGKTMVITFANGELEASDVANDLRASRIAINLMPRHFLFRALELPAQAAGFMDGIVRAQIDRLTPWAANAVVFGCSTPKTLDAEHISAAVAATPRAFAMNYVQAVLAFGLCL